MGRIRMMIRESAIHITKQLDHFTAQHAVQVTSEGAGDAITGVNRNRHRPRQLDVTDDALQIGVTNIVPAIAASAAGKTAGNDGLVKRGNGLAINRFAAQYHFEAVVVGRVMTAGDHNAVCGTEHMGCVIQHRCSNHTQINYINACRLQAAGEGIGQLRAGEATIAADDDGIVTTRADRAAKGLADLACNVGVQRCAEYAAYVVGFENAWC